MILKYSVYVIATFGGGIVTGGAYAAFITLLKVIPRLTHITDTRKTLKTYQNIFVLGGLTFIIIYFSDFSIRLGEITTAVIGLIIGSFIGIFSSALAEVLNVIPIITKKIKIKERLKITIYALVAGKVLGSLYFFLIH